MRKFLTTLFAVSALTVPAVASDVPAGDNARPRGHARTDANRESNDSDRGEARRDRSAPSAERERFNTARPERPQMTGQQAGPAEWQRHGMSDPAPRPAANEERRGTAREWSRPDRTADAPTAERRRDGNWADRNRGDRPSGAFGSNVASRDAQQYQWTRNWRDDRRYDWRSYRDRNRTTFRIGAYYDPYGTSYRRWNVGWSMRPSYYRSNYWISDPWQYRLPEVYGPYKWVRYYDDAVLVNTWSGEVVDVIYNFFW